jgi:hypothetical protein
MIAALLLALICLDPPPHPSPFRVQVYSVRQDGAGHACDCSLAPCGDRGPGCSLCDDNGCTPCPPLVEPDCFITDQCGNVGACAYLDIHAYPTAMVWRAWAVQEDTCIETDVQEDRVGWMTWWRVQP